MCVSGGANPCQACVRLNMCWLHPDLLTVSYNFTHVLVEPVTMPFCLQHCCTVCLKVNELQMQCQVYF